MKRYKHTAVISLRKRIIQYINSIDGTVVSTDNIRWRTCSITGNKYVIIKGRQFTHQEFIDTFTEYVCREQELIQLTLNTVTKESGQNNRAYPIELFI